MEQSLIEILAAWAGRNPVYPLILLGPIVVAVAAVLVNARRATPVAREEAPAPQAAAVAPAAPALVETPETLAPTAQVPPPEPALEAGPKPEPELEPEPAPPAGLRAPGHYGDAVGERHRLLLIVCHENESNA